MEQEEGFIVAYGSFFKSLFVGIGLFSLILFHATGKETVPVSYLLPEHHPIKPLLDSLFSSSRVILNLDTLEEAGFVYSKPRKFTNLIVAKHPAIPGYIFKLYLDAQRDHKNKPEHHFWMLRIQGAVRVRFEIEANNLQEWIKVPQKWIYKLPKKPLPSKGYRKKHYILVEEDMQLLSPEDNESLWASSYVTIQHLHAIHLILGNVGLSDCAKPDNMPFSIDGRIAFIDTQTHGRSVSYNHLSSWLSTENQTLWQKMTE